MVGMGWRVMRGVWRVARSAWRVACSVSPTRLYVVSSHSATGLWQGIEGHIRAFDAQLKRVDPELHAHLVGVAAPWFRGFVFHALRCAHSHTAGVW